MSLVHTENVLVVPDRIVSPAWGISKAFLRRSRSLSGRTCLVPPNTSYRPRGEMEENPSFKQLIPYVIFRHRDDPAARARCFNTPAAKAWAKAGCTANAASALAGTLRFDDRTHEDAVPYAEGMHRELDEEVNIDTPFTERCVGLINDDQTPVGQVHLGVVHLFDVERPAVQPRESEILDAGFRPVSELLADLDRFESWSQFCLKALFA